MVDDWASQTSWIEGSSGNKAAVDRHDRCKLC
jgi:hypothetical protein